jgi:hypothetical protein
MNIFPLLETYYSAILVALIVCAVFVIASLIFRACFLFWDMKRLKNEERIYIEITPQVNSSTTPIETAELLNVIHGIGMARTVREKLLRRRLVIGIELVSTKSEGIRHIVTAPATTADALEHAIKSHMQSAKIKRIPDYMASELNDGSSKLLAFKQTGSWYFPLKNQRSYLDHDSMSYLTNALTGLNDNELISVQLVMVPVYIREASEIAENIQKNVYMHDLTQRSSSPLRLIGSIVGGVVSFVTDLFFGSIQTHHSQTSHKLEADLGLKPARSINLAEQLVNDSINDKVKQRLFRTSIRVAIVSTDSTRSQEYAKSIKGTFSSLSTPYQQLRAFKVLPLQRVRDLQALTFKYRLPSILQRNDNILAASEIAELHHFPVAETKTENHIQSLSPYLPAPISLKNGTQLEVVFAKNTYGNSNTPIGLTSDERSMHMYVVGATKMGKTTLLKQSMYQDILAGRGLAFIDPHGDAAQELLAVIPKERIKDVVYFNPDDLDNPIGLNLLELGTGLSDNDLLRQKELITETTVSIFRKIFSDEDKGGHRIEYLIRNTVQTALTLENPTLFTIFDLLNDPKFRKTVVASLENEHLQNFWRYEFAKAGDFQQVKMSAGVTNKVGRFLFSASVERIIGQKKSTINFDDIINSGKILICNFSKGLLGEDTSALFGITTLAQLQMATMRRARLPEADRKPFYLYVDEFQNFATPSFKQLLSESRKYKVYLTIAQQTTSQHSDQLMVNEILANVGTIVCFRTGSPLDEQYFLPFMDGRVEPGMILNQPRLHFYIKIMAETPQEAFSGETILITDRGNSGVTNKVIESSRKNYAAKYLAPIKSKATKPKASKKKNATAKLENVSLDDALAKDDF